MAGPHRTSYAILGLLAQGPKSGYEIKREVETTISHFWKESFGHIYPTLSRLVAEGLAAPAEDVAGGRADRRRYAITPAGLTALRAWVAAPVEPAVTRNELALKIFFGQHVALAVSLRHVAEYRAYHAHALATYRERQPDLERQAQSGAAEAPFALLTLQLGIDYCLAMLAWCDSAERRLGQMLSVEC